MIFLTKLKIINNIILSNASKKYTWFVGDRSTDEDSTLLLSLLHYLHNTLILSFSKYLLSIYYVTGTTQPWERIPE